MIRVFGALAIIVVFSFLMSRRTKKQRAAVWQGVVTDIKHQRPRITRDEDRGAEDWVTIHYRTDEGRDDRFKIRMRVFRDFFSGLKPGDRLNKAQGAYLPRLESCAAEPVATEPAAAGQV
jgi:hypothetical protein